MNKKLIRLTEADLHRIVRESVNRVLREEYPNWGERTSLAYGGKGRVSPHDEAQGIRDYWKKEGLQGDELERKVQTTMHNNTLRRNGLNYRGNGLNYNKGYISY